MFLYGMQMMADGMQKSTGSRMKDILGMLTNNRFLGVCLGALITAIIQSSGATTVMVVGFVSAGMMSLSQAVGVIMGANIGTTITAWIVSLSQIGDSMKVLNPEFYAPVLIGIGALIYARTKGHKTAGEVTAGIGLLFLGLKLMSESIGPYTSSPVFANVFTLLGRNPFLGVLAGFVITAILQSSSVSVGILQTLALNGVVLTNAAIYLTLGQNIGSCVTALLSSIGGNRTAKRAAVIHISFNTIGAILVGTTGYVFFSLHPEIASHRITSVEISMFHTLFNLGMTCLLFPFSEKLVALSGFLVRKKKNEQEEPAQEETEEDGNIRNIAKRLDRRILSTPSLALETVSGEIVRMGEFVFSDVETASLAARKEKITDIAEVMDNEKIINDAEKALTDYLICVENTSLNEQQKQTVTDLFNSVNDLERIGDHADNIAKGVRDLHNRNLRFSESAVKDLEEITEGVQASLRYALEARKTGSADFIRKANRAYDEVKTMEENLREKHIERLTAGKCIPAAGIIFIGIISDLERIADHALSVADYMKKEIG